MMLPRRHCHDIIASSPDAAAHQALYAAALAAADAAAAFPVWLQMLTAGMAGDGALSRGR